MTGIGLYLKAISNAKRELKESQNKVKKAAQQVQAIEDTLIYKDQIIDFMISCKTDYITIWMGASPKEGRYNEELLKSLLALEGLSLQVEDWDGHVYIGNERPSEKPPEGHRMHLKLVSPEVWNKLKMHYDTGSCD